MDKPGPIETDHIETLIRNGSGLEVRRWLGDLNVESLSRKETLKIANFARRVGLAELTVKLLGPLVLPKYDAVAIATHEERAEYACALIKLGILREAAMILGDLRSDEVPEALLYLSFAHFARWDYEASIPLLNRYLQQVEDPYQKIVGSVNLAAALVYVDRLQEATVLLATLADEARRANAHLIEGYCFELWGQAHFELGDFAQASTCFESAETKLLKSGSRNIFFVKKWKALLDIARARPVSSHAIQRLATVRNEALANADWENVRQCDLFEGLLTEQPELVLKVYFGTPHTPFRKKLEKRSRGFIQIPDFFERVIGAYEPAGSAAAPTRRVFDIESGREIGSAFFLKTGQVQHRLLQILASDSYRPFRITELFSQLFDREFFDPTVSPNRVHQSIARLRSWLTEHEVPLQLIESDSSFRLSSEHPHYALKVPRQIRDGTLTAIVDLLRLRFADRSFSLLQAADELEVASRTLSRQLKQATEQNLIEKIGGGSSTKYRMK